MDELAFFHQGAMHICGSLDLQEAVTSCYFFFREHMPLEGMQLNIFEPENRAIRIIANYGILRNSLVHGQLVPLDDQGIDFIRLQMSARGTERVKLAFQSDDMPVARHIQQAIGLPMGSYLVLHLAAKNEKLGVVVIYSSKPEAFTQEHAHLLGLLHDPFAIALSNALRYREVVRLQELLNDDNRFLRSELRQITGDEIVGGNFGLRAVMDLVGQVAPLDSSVLLLGETGVGKEVVANALHYSSPRAGGPMVKVNCGAIPDSIIDSELFGHEKGAFTGAVARKRGRFERANGGTIFLDEVAELPPAAQVRLLRVLQTKEIERVGGSESLRVDARIIAATHRDLPEMVRRGLFREDLWFRLNVFPITIPPLRMRKVDIPALVSHFIERKARDMNLPHLPAASSEGMARLVAHDWPGNVRELENAVERELIRNHGVGPGTLLEFADLIPVSASPPEAEDEPPPIPSGRGLYQGPITLDEVLRRHIVQVLGRTEGRVQGPGGAAELLGVNPSTLRHRMRRLGIAFGRGPAT